MPRPTPAPPATRPTELSAATGPRPTQLQKVGGGLRWGARPAPTPFRSARSIQLSAATGLTPTELQKVQGVERRGAGFVAGLALAVALVAAGCSGSSDAGSGSTKADAATTSTAPKAAEHHPVGFQGPLETFYGSFQDPPTDLPHGTLLQFQEMDDYGFSGATAYRIMYTSTSLEGDPIVVTGIGVVPTAKAPAGGRPMITISHGTTGIADECAPSKDPKVTETTLVGKALATDFLIAATDYEGLGTPGRHPYLVGQSEGRSSIDALLAAGQLPNAHPGKRFAIAGYSQGGHGAIWTSQVAAEWAPKLQVVGTFAGAPASEIGVILAAAPYLPQAGFAYMIVAGFGAAYPQLDVNDYLTPEGAKLLDAVDTGCAQDTFAAVAGKSPKELILPNAYSGEWKRLAEANDAGTKKTNDAPTLIVHSKGDGTVPLAFSEMLLARMCKTGQVVERRLIDAGGHGPAAPAAYDEGMAWIKARFATSSPAPVDSCP